MEKNDIAALRTQLEAAINGSHAHIDFATVLDDFPPETRGKRVPGAPHTAWQLLEHVRIAQFDILEFSRNPKYKSPKWPDEYWPPEDAPPSSQAWDETVIAFKRDFEEMRKLIETGDLFARIPGGNGQTLLREALLVANHNSYHLGQLVFLRKMLA